MKNPNGYGSVYKLSGQRRKPFMAVRTIGWCYETGNQKRVVLGYFKTRKEALQSLAKNIDIKFNIETMNLTFENVWNKWILEHSEKVTEKTLKVIKSRKNNFKPFLKMKFVDIKLIDYQDFFDQLQLSTGNMRNLKGTLTLIYKYAMRYEIIERNYPELVTIKKAKAINTRNKVFSKDEINLLWKNKNLIGIDGILIMIYTGLRIGELLSLKKADINIEERYLIGGSKTTAGKNRCVPINSKILSLFEIRMRESKVYLFEKDGKEYKYNSFSNSIKKSFKVLNLSSHTIHDCRHTFATLLNNADANTTSIKQIIGHSSFNTTEKIYTHKDIDELRKAIDLI